MDTTINQQLNNIENKLDTINENPPKETFILIGSDKVVNIESSILIPDGLEFETISGSTVIRFPDENFTINDIGPFTGPIFTMGIASLLVFICMGAFVHLTKSFIFYMID